RRSRRERLPSVTGPCQRAAQRQMQSTFRGRAGEEDGRREVRENGPGPEKKELLAPKVGVSSAFRADPRTLNPGLRRASPARIGTGRLQTAALLAPPDNC